MSVLGGRIGALRESLAAADDALLTGAVERNVTLGPAGNPARIAALLRGLGDALDQVPADDLLAARIVLP